MTRRRHSSTEPKPVLSDAWRERLGVLAVGSALFILFIDQTALTTALPELARSLNADPVHLKLSLTAYMLIQAALVPASGWIADRFGARRVFIVSMAIFVVGSALCALSQSLGDLILYRLVQGVGAAMMTPLGRIIIIGTTPRERLVKAMLLYTLPAAIGPVVGPSFTGVILSVADWPWIFWINVPFGLAGMWAVAAFVPKLREPDPGRFDALGFLLAAITITGAMLVAETVGFDLVPWQLQVGAGVIAAVTGVALVRHLRTAAKPVMDLKLLKYAAYRISMIGGIFPRIAFGAAPFLTPLLLQEGLGWSPLKTGLVVTASAVGAIASRFVSPWALKQFGFRAVLIGSTSGFGITLAAAAIFGDWTPVAVVGFVLLLSGLLRSMMFNALNTIAYDEIPARSVSAAATFYSVVMQLSLSFGVTLSALLLQWARAGAGGPLTTQSFTLPLVALGALGLGGIWWFRRMTPEMGAGMAGRGVASTPT